MAINTVAAPVNLPAWDPRLTGSLKATGDKAADDAKLKKACQEMESVFLNMLLKSMRDTVSKTEIGGNNKQTDIIQSMLDTELTRNMAAAGGTGKMTAVVVDVTSLPYMTVAATTTKLTSEELKAGEFIVKK